MNIGRVLGNIATLVTLLVVWMLVMVVLAQKNRIDGAESTAAALKDDVAALHSSRRPEDSALQAPAPVPAPAPDPAPDAETILSLRADVTDLRETVAGYENALRGLRLALSARNDGRLEQEVGTVKERTRAIGQDVEALKARFDNSGIQ